MIYKQQEIQLWAGAKGIYDDGGVFMTQVKGMAEEVVEVTEAYCEQFTGFSTSTHELACELGDIYIFWINACLIGNVEPKDCIDAAYDKVIKREGKMVNGRFVKD